MFCSSCSGIAGDPGAWFGKFEISKISRLIFHCGGPYYALLCTVVAQCMRAHPHRVFAVLGRYSESRVIRRHGTWRGMSWTTFPRSAERQRAHREAQGCIFEKCLLSALRSSEKQSFCIFESQNDICIHRAWRLSGLPFHQMDRSTGF